MRSSGFFFLAGFLSLAACATEADDGDPQVGAEEELTAAPAVIPASYQASKLGYVGSLRYNTPSLAVRRPSLFKVPTFELEGTIGDEVEIRVTGRVAGENPALVVLGPLDPAAYSRCATWSAATQRWCLEGVPSPVVASNDDADATTKNPKLRMKLTSPRLRIGVVGASVFDVVVDSVASALDPDACKKTSAAATPGDKGSFSRVRLTRDCKDYAGRDCGPWREVSRAQGRHSAYVPAPAGTARKVVLQDDGGSYTWIRCTYHDCSTRVTEDCLARTDCSVSPTGDVTCAPWQEASVTLNRRTALDADTCNAIERPVRYSGVLGDKCLSLSTGLERVRTASGGYTESQTVIVTSW